MEVVSCSKVVSHSFLSFKADRTYDVRSSDNGYSKQATASCFSDFQLSEEAFNKSIEMSEDIPFTHRQYVQTRSLSTDVPALSLFNDDCQLFSQPFVITHQHDAFRTKQHGNS